MKKRTYYIVENEEEGDRQWRAYKRGFWSVLGSFNSVNNVIGTYSLTSADNCEHKLRRKLKSDKVIPKVVRVLKI